MNIVLRDYQQKACDDTYRHIVETVDNCLIRIATAGGKSHIVANLGQRIHEASGEGVLCLAPNAELVTQNREKFKATGYPSSIFSASAGAKCFKHPVIFATPGTFLNSIDRIKKPFAAVITDECHGITPSIKTIVERLRERNERTRHIGLSATPYRLGEGYIYSTRPDGSRFSEDYALNPYFQQCTTEVLYRDLVGRYVAPVTVGSIDAEQYDTAALLPNTRHAAADVDRAFVGQGRLTAQIVADIVHKSRDRQGVLIYAATCDHAREIMDSLPQSISAVVTGDTAAKTRRKIVADFKSRKLKYLVNVGVYTTGFDVPHVDVIAILRATESPALLEQIIGRGVRMSDGKDDCLLLDYAGNVENHFPDGELFAPRIVTKRNRDAGEPLTIKCPTCSHNNLFAPRDNEMGLKVSPDGYFIDSTGQRIQVDGIDLPAHYGRRCTGSQVADDTVYQCAYRWSGKDCANCGYTNDITARKCKDCGLELVDPNEKLIAEFKAYKRDPHNRQTDEVLSWAVSQSKTAGNEDCVIVNYVTEWRNVKIWYFPNKPHEWQIKRWREFMAATKDFTEPPKTITYFKQKDSKYFNLVAYNLAAD